MGEMVQFPFAGGTTGGYLATPEQGSGPGIVVIQEWWGLVDHIKDVCDRFADEEFEDRRVRRLLRRASKSETRSTEPARTCAQYLGRQRSLGDARGGS